MLPSNINSKKTLYVIFFQTAFRARAALPQRRSAIDHALEFCLPVIMIVSLSIVAPRRLFCCDADRRAAVSIVLFFWKISKQLKRIIFCLKKHHNSTSK